MKPTIYICLFTLLTACSQSMKSTTSDEAKSDNELVEESLGLIAHEIDLRVSRDGSGKLNALVKEAYEDRGFLPIWTNGDTLHPSAYEMATYLEESWGYGLPKDYQGEQLVALIDSVEQMELGDKRKPSVLSRIEILLSYNSLQFVADLRYGILDKDSLWLTDKIDSLSGAEVNQFLSGAEGQNLASVIEDYFFPTHYEARQIIAGLQKYVTEFELSDEHFTMPNYKQDSIKANSIARQAMIAHGFADSSYLQVDSLFRKALGNFQVWHGLEPDLKIGNNTKLALGSSNLDRYLQAVATLEKWKNSDIFKGDKYIYVNVPAYQLKLYEQGEPTKVHRVVVGAPYTRTPSFSAKLKYIQVNPLWHVPYSISSGEILPKLRSDVEYLKRNGYNLYTSDHQSVDPNSVDWSTVSQNNFRYRIVQNSGRYNSLGIIAFMFPNEHSVFIHDTPSKYFFSRDVRAFSHGCVRLQDPVDLASYILEGDENDIYTRDTLDTLITNHVRKRINLNTFIDVHIQYFTTQAEQGELVFYKDVYGRDEKIRARLRSFIEESRDPDQIQ